MTSREPPHPFAALAVFLSFAAGLSPAQAGQDGAAGAKPLRIVTSFYPIYIAALNVVGDAAGVELSNLAQAQAGCLRDYQLTTDDMIRLSRADIFVAHGAGMESFLDKVVKERPNLNIVRAADGIELIKGRGSEGDNPHVWLSVSLYMKEVGTMAAGLARLDPARADAYRANAAAYIARLDALREDMREELKGLGTRDIVTFHEAFPYFAREFELRVAAVIEREPGSEPGAKELAACIGVVRKAGIKALFAEPQYPARSAEIIARETGAKVWRLDPAVTGPMKADAYVEIMRSNLRVLREALK